MLRVLAVALIGAALVGCSGQPSGSNPPPTATPSPTPTVEPIDPTPPAPEPTATPTSTPPHSIPVTPAPTDGGWTHLTDWLLALGLELPDALPPQADEIGDGSTADGSVPAAISPDLDIISWIAGWAQLPASLFTGDGALACSHEAVLCTDDPLPPSDPTAIVAAVRVSDLIELGQDRAGQISLVMTRPGFPNTSGSGGYSGADLVIVADLTAANIFALEWKNNGGFVIAPRRGGEARAVLVGDTVLFIIPNDIEERPSGRFVTFERIPPTEPSAGRIDFAPALDSFFDITYRFNFGN